MRGGSRLGPRGAGRSGSVRRSRQAAKVKRTRPGVGSCGVRRRGAAAPRTVALPLQGLPEALLREARHGHAVQQARLSRVGYRSLPVDDWLEGHQWNARWAAPRSSTITIRCGDRPPDGGQSPTTTDRTPPGTAPAAAGAGAGSHSCVAHTAGDSDPGRSACLAHPFKCACFARALY